MPYSLEEDGDLLDWSNQEFAFLKPHFYGRANHLQRAIEAANLRTRWCNKSLKMDKKILVVAASAPNIIAILS